jgi:hypothetical protein
VQCSLQELVTGPFRH